MRAPVSTKFNRVVTQVLVVALLGAMMVGAGLLGVRLSTAINAEEGQPAACFTAGDPGVIFSTYTMDSQTVHRVWLRVHTTHTYWQHEDGRYGVMLNSPDHDPWEGARE